MSNKNNVGVYIGYFRQLAVSHKDIKHDPDSEINDSPIGAQHFTKFGVDEITKGLRGKIGFPCLCVQLYDNETSSSVVSDVRQRPQGSFMVIDNPADKSFAAEEACYEKQKK